MAKIKVHAGDFLEGDSQYSFGSLILKTKEHNFLGETIPITELELVDIASEENVKSLAAPLAGVWLAQLS